MKEKVQLPEQQLTAGLPGSTAMATLAAQALMEVVSDSSVFTLYPCLRVTTSSPQGGWEEVHPVLTPYRWRDNGLPRTRVQTDSAFIVPSPVFP